MIYHNLNFGPSFGKDSDLRISNQANFYYSIGNIGNTYENVKYKFG